MLQDISFARFLTRYASRIFNVSWQNGSIRRIDVKGELFTDQQLTDFIDICNSKGILVYCIID